MLDQILKIIIFIGAPAYITLHLHYIVTHPKVRESKLAARRATPGGDKIWEGVYSKAYRNAWAFVLLWAIIDTLTKAILNTSGAPKAVKGLAMLFNFALFITALYKLGSFHSRLFRKTNPNHQAADSGDDWKLPS